ncbi:hypothetical protein PM082_024184 [Marasmius tenuissimus]|nr:hypothetical protein PM082_024184 [Marasmius tenuissimus]
MSTKRTRGKRPANPAIFDYDFIDEGRRRFQTIPNALSYLKRMSGPPSSPSNPSNPPSQITTVLLIFACMASHSDVGTAGPSGKAATKSNWDLVGSWIRYLVEGFILVKEEITTVEGMDVFNRSLGFIPVVVNLGQSDDEHCKALASDPYLRAMFVQVWLKLMDEGHPATGLWAGSLSRLWESTGEDQQERFLTSGSELLRQAPYRDASYSQIGSLLVRHLNHIAQVGATISWHKLNGIFSTISLIWGTTFSEKDDRPPIYQPDVVRHTVSALVDILSCFLHKRKSLRVQHDDDRYYNDGRECEVAYDIVNGALGLLRCGMMCHEVLAMESGILTAFFKTMPCYFRIDRHLNKDPPNSIFKTFREILEAIATMLVYPDVLHQFLKAVKRIEASKGLGTRMKKSKEFWIAWEQTKKKAMTLREVRQRMQVRNISRCDYSQCPLRPPAHFDATRGRSALSYFRCSVCRSVLYCSKSCQRSDWKIGHREQCAQFAYKLQNRGDFQAPLAMHNTQFFKECTRFLILRHAEEVATGVESYLFGLPQSEGDMSPDDGLLRAEIKNPLVLFNFRDANAELPKPEILSTAALATRVKSFESPWTDSVAVRWRESGVGQANIMVVGLFPQNEGEPYVVEEVFEFPVESSHELDYIV